MTQVQLPHSIGRRTRVARTTRRTTVSRLYLLTVIKVAVVIWTLFGLLMIGAVFAAWAFLTATGAVDSAERFVVDSTGMEDFEILSRPILTALVMLVGLFVLVAVTCTVAAAAFYNALARTIGGVDVALRDDAATAFIALPEALVVDEPHQNGDGCRCWACASRVPQQVEGPRSNGHAEGSSVSKS
ncbi:MAG: DUF3566 domain-containing protein [Acidimicrobiia bacterium]